MALLLQLASTILVLLVTSVAINIAKQLFFKDRRKPPVVYHWFPGIGSTVDYGQDPYAFFFKCRERYGDVFTFGLLGMKVTVYLGTQGNNFILNGKHKDLNAEEVYGPLTIPVFGPGVVYDVDNARFMDQKRLLKEGFTTASLRAYVPQFVYEVESYLADNPTFNGSTGICDISTAISEMALYCAAGSLQGKEVRDAFDSTFAVLFRHLDDAFAPINFIFPGLPLPINRRRDHAQKAMAKLYLDIIHKRRAEHRSKESYDMLWALMGANYKDGTPISNEEIANMMIALLMGGQHNTAASGTWIMLELAHRPHLIQELYLEQQKHGLSGDCQPQYSDLGELSLHNAVIKETLRLHSPIHSIMRKVKSPMPIPGTDMIVPEDHILLAAPSFPSRLDEYFPNAAEWDPYRWLSSLEKSQTADESARRPDGLTDTIDYGYGAVSSKAALSPYLPFGAGRHRCVGETFAYAQLTVILATLVRHLEWEQVDLASPVPKTDYSSMFSRPMHPSTIRWRKRESGA